MAVEKIVWMELRRRRTTQRFSRSVHDAYHIILIKNYLVNMIFNDVRRA